MGWLSTATMMTWVQDGLAHSVRMCRDDFPLDAARQTVVPGCLRVDRFHNKARVVSFMAPTCLWCAYGRGLK